MFLTLFSLVLPNSSFAQGMMSHASSTQNGAIPANMNHTAQEEADGRVVWNKLQSKELSCAVTSEQNFETLGEFFMGQMMGNAHETMNDMITERMGEDGEAQMHSTIGKRLSGCDIAAPFPAQTIAHMPMMKMMGGEWITSLSDNKMNFGPTRFWMIGLVLYIAWWILIIMGIIALVRWLSGYSRRHPHNHEKPPLEILKERYASGLIDKKDFDERKKDLS
jgi:putative membrane protein